MLMWIFIAFGVLIVFLTILVVVIYYLVARKYYWPEGSEPSRRSRENAEKKN